MRKLLILSFLASAAGCAFTARGADLYRDDTTALLATRQDGIKSCYDEILKVDPGAKGAVAVHFVIKKKTGDVTDVAVVPEKTTAPESVQRCVLAAFEGLKLTPPDDRTDGDATFVWEFEARGAKRSQDPRIISGTVAQK